MGGLLLTTMAIAKATSFAVLLAALALSCSTATSYGSADSGACHEAGGACVPLVGVSCPTGPANVCPYPYWCCLYPTTPDAAVGD